MLPGAPSDRRLPQYRTEPPDGNPLAQSEDCDGELFRRCGKVEASIRVTAVETSLLDRVPKLGTLLLRGLQFGKAIGFSFLLLSAHATFVVEENRLQQSGGLHVLQSGVAPAEPSPCGD